MEYPATLSITMFGSFSMLYQKEGCDDRSITDQTLSSKKLWAFLSYLISFRHKGIPQNEIIDVLWSNEEISDPVNTLKTLLHRARHILETLGFPDGKQVILYRRGTYSLNSDLEMSVDTEQFEALCAEAAGLVDSGARLACILRAISLYSGSFLPKAAGEPWVVSLRVYYHTRYLRLCAEAAELFNAAARYEEAINICRSALAIDPYEEVLHLILMKTLSASGARQAALQHYSYVTGLFMDQLGVSPSEEITALYRELSASEKSVELNLRVVRDSLDEEPTAHGAFFCEYTVFQDIYRLEARAAARSGRAIQLAMLTLLDTRGNHLGRKQGAAAMNLLQDAILSNLRMGDSFSRFSISQYLVLFPSASLENANKALSRIVTNFKASNPRLRVSVQYSLLPVLPATFEGPDTRPGRRNFFP